LSAIDLRDAGEINRAIAVFARGSNGGLIVVPNALANVHHIPTFDISNLSQAALKRDANLSQFSGRPDAEEPDHRHSRLLRASRERPCCHRNAEERDELSPSDVAHSTFLQPGMVFAIDRPCGPAHRIVRLPQTGHQVLGKS
jgi:hypothetical protein